MAKILPSQAVAAIQAMFPDLLKKRGSAEPPPRLPDARGVDVSAAIAVVSEVPGELLQLSGIELAEFTVAQNRCRHFVAACARPFDGGGWDSSQYLPGEMLLSLLALLGKCPDQAVPASTAHLLFIDDAGLRDSLRVDIAEVNRAMTDGEWKSATVVCGSVIEALLLWALGRDEAAAQSSAIRIKTAVNKFRTGVSIAEWHLEQYIEVALDLNLLRPDDTAPQLRLAKDFRNLIHPGRAIRLSRSCDQPTTLATVAGLGFLIRDLSTKE